MESQLHTWFIRLAVSARMENVQKLNVCIAVTLEHYKSGLFSYHWFSLKLAALVLQIFFISKPLSYSI